MKKKINVFGQEVQIKLEKGPIFVGEDHVLGYYDTEKKLIVVDKTLPMQMRLQTLYHEMMHALFYRLGLEKTSMHHDMHEVLVEGIAKFLEENFKLK